MDGKVPEYTDLDLYETSTEFNVMLYDAVMRELLKENDGVLVLQDVVKVLIQKARDGDVPAIALIFDIAAQLEI
jgi:hypothetical protein